ncbi:low affinity immunoglobulin gamma Fc region receptor III-A-like isoform 3-T3 [Molossus nigricans]
MGMCVDPVLSAASASTGAEGQQKAVVSLHPEWDRLLERDNVTLKCQGPQAEGHNATWWWRSGALLSNHTSSYFISLATVSDSGEYSCQTSLSERSDPVPLHVQAAWLQLQARRWVVQEGDPITLRCHSWKNIPIHKVQYFQNGRGRKFSHQNSDFHIPRAAGKHNGSYFCRAMIGTLNVSSDAVNIVVQALPAPPTSLGLPVLFCLLLGLLFAVDTGLYFSVQSDLRNSLRNRRNDNVTWSKSPEDKQEQSKEIV